ncbi:carboxylating nicotinate-nucleotide diphosphorylase [Romboutsia sedimentorum]|uniref:nicotinate-nucleotide diphosphorylase (carboxylating) n=1 Tax=Romboutsia sedimentorum TaxID=1368474 RepID=A0ABT7EAI4_9FIRM|nr:carboxylating nicotinate-nucleotide diphosphorylase [Romboutsia sedimentorum]MDK2563942.1 carboxylating nicotinate-nucleotide diphosphorylase [Romboutsia sedimentorum]
MNYLTVDKIIKEALIEDVPNEDISTNAIISEDSLSSIELLCKEEGIIAGLKVFKRVYEILGNVEVILYKKDGDKIYPKDKLAFLKGSTRNILLGERVSLNLIQRMSGIATLTNLFVSELENSNTKLLDTRKTTPTLRILEKYAVKVGGGDNHRFNLSDGIMLKDNHISACGTIEKAVDIARENISFVRKIEVETENLDMVKEAIKANVDIIMLDNMDLEMAKEAVKIINKKAITEFSGNVSLQNIKKIAQIGVDYVSVGAITHSFKVLDLSMKNLNRIN